MATRKLPKKSPTTRPTRTEVQAEALLPTTAEKKAWEQIFNTWRIPTLVLVVLVLFWYMTNSWPIAGFVNYKPIWRWEVNEAMYDQIGQQTLDNLITEELIKAELAKNNVEVSEEEIDGQINEIKQQIGSEESFAQALAFQGMTEETLREQIRMQVGLERLVEPSTDSAQLSENVYDRVQKIRAEGQVWLVPQTNR